MAAKNNTTGAAEGAKSFSAKLRYARITARKARLVADLIRGRTVNQALEVLGFEHKRAASFYSGLVRSAMANAGQEEGVNVNQLVITDCRADDGPMLQGRMRFRPGPQGRAHPFKKLTSHLTVVVSQPAEIEGKRRRSVKSKSAAKRKAAAANAQ
jgi:large subunit ribosomal protein L22